MIQTLLDERCEAGLTRPMAFFGNPEILFDLVPDFGDFLVPLDLIFCKARVNLVLPHNPVTDTVHVQKVTIGFAAVSFVGINVWRKLLPMKAVGNNEEK